MAFDGIMISALVSELNNKILNGRITKIAQPETDELYLTIKNSFTSGESTKRTTERLMISVNPSLPLIYLRDDNKPSPLKAPTFCMVLRKHLNNCRISGIYQINLERVICMELNHLNEMGDKCIKKLYIELMGKHSNIIFCDENDNIIDSIKHISHLVSSVREVLPGRKYFIPNTEDKANPLDISEDEFFNAIRKPMPLYKALYMGLTGISPLSANELLSRASLSDRESADELTEMEAKHLYRNFCEMIYSIKQCDFNLSIYYQNGEPKDFSPLNLSLYDNNDIYTKVIYDSPSEMLFEYYETKASISRIRQKSSNLRKITSMHLERSRKKLDLQRKQLKDTLKKDKYKQYGDLLTTYGYELKGGEKKFTCENYYTGKEITIPLDENLSALENAKKYFNKYSKLKRTSEAMEKQISESEDEVRWLDTITMSLDLAKNEADLTNIKNELTDYGYIKKGQKTKGKQNTKKSKPLHYISSDGYHIYVGKNNYQNDELTFKIAKADDWWFHAKKAAGSHVIVKTNGDELPDTTFEEAARLAAHYSKAASQEKAEIDYIQKKHIKKPNGSKPGFVVYYTNYSMTIETDISGIQIVEE